MENEKKYDSSIEEIGTSTPFQFQVDYDRICVLINTKKLWLFQKNYYNIKYIGNFDIINKKWNQIKDFIIFKEYDSSDDEIEWEGSEKTKKKRFPNGELFVYNKEAIILLFCSRNKPFIHGIAEFDEKNETFVKWMHFKVSEKAKIAFETISYAIYTLVNGEWKNGQNFLIVHDQGKIQCFEISINFALKECEINWICKLECTKGKFPLKLPINAAVCGTKLILQHGNDVCGLHWFKDDLIRFDLFKNNVEVIKINGNLDPRYIFYRDFDIQSNSWLHLTGEINDYEVVAKPIYFGNVWVIEDAFSDIPRWIKTDIVIPQGNPLKPIIAVDISEKFIYFIDKNYAVFKISLNY